MLTVQIWRPDTCGCEIHEAFDDLDPNPQPYYVTEEEAEAIRLERLRLKPRTTNRNPQPPSWTCPDHYAHSDRTPVKQKVLISGEGEAPEYIEFDRKPTAKGVHDVVREENRRKNLALDLAVKRKLGIDPEGDVTTEVKQRLGLNRTGRLSRRQQREVDEYVADLYESFEWEFDASRRLILKSADALTPAEKATLSSQANARFGAGKVVIS